MLDITTILGLVAGFALIGAAIVLGGSPLAFIDAPSILIVFGGTFAVTIMSYSIGDVVAAGTAIARTLSRKQVETSAAASQMIEMSELARRKGALALQSLLPKLRGLPFLNEGISMVIDGANVDEIESLLTHRVEAMAARHARTVGVLRRAAEVSPAMGLIGTLVGLVQMLGNLDDPSTIGPSMAVALLTTFYGAVLSNMVFTPLAAKLERESDDEILRNTIFLTGVTSIGRRENPRRLEMLINTLLPPAQHVHYFD